ncbi:hypothetical protein BGW80DRAFT_1518907, partial [Lactifluus volemus]
KVPSQCLPFLFAPAAELPEQNSGDGVATPNLRGKCKSTANKMTNPQRPPWKPPHIPAAPTTEPPSLICGVGPLTAVKSSSPPATPGCSSAGQSWPRRIGFRDVRTTLDPCNDRFTLGVISRLSAHDLDFITRSSSIGVHEKAGSTDADIGRWETVSAVSGFLRFFTFLEKGKVLENALKPATSVDFTLLTEECTFQAGSSPQGRRVRLVAKARDMAAAASMNEVDCTLAKWKARSQEVSATLGTKKGSGNGVGSALQALQLAIARRVCTYSSEVKYFLNGYNGNLNIFMLSRS